MMVAVAKKAFGVYHTPLNKPLPVKKRDRINYLACTGISRYL